MNPGQARPSPKCFKIRGGPKNMHENHSKNKEHQEICFGKVPKSKKSTQKQWVVQLNFGDFSLGKSL